MIKNEQKSGWWDSTDKLFGDHDCTYFCILPPSVINSRPSSDEIINHIVALEYLCVGGYFINVLFDEYSIDDEKYELKLINEDELNETEVLEFRGWSILLNDENNEIIEQGQDDDETRDMLRVIIAALDFQNLSKESFADKKIL